MEADEDFVVIVVKEENDPDVDWEQLLNIKTENSNTSYEEGSEEFIQHIGDEDIKTEPANESEAMEYLQNELSLNLVAADDINVEYIIPDLRPKLHSADVNIECVPDLSTELHSADDDDYDEGEDYIPDISTELDTADENSLQYEPKETRTRVRKRRKRPKSKSQDPKLYKCFVEKLCEDNPELGEDNDALINALVTIMTAVKKPVLGDDCYTKTEQGHFLCKECGLISLTKSSCDNHYLENHGPRYLICFACGREFKFTASLYRHEKRCVAQNAPIVQAARQVYLRNRKLVVAQQDKKRFCCELCSAEFTSNFSLKSHLRTHRGERPFQCDLCSRTYTSNAGLTKHMWSHSEADYICDLCGRGFRYKYLLSAHMYTHGEPRYPCAECPRRFTYKMALQLHVRSRHRNLPPPCACIICPKRFGRMWALKDHMKKAHGMIIMTRRMFFKEVPRMTETEIKEAKVVLKSESEILFPSELDMNEPTQSQDECQLLDNTDSILDCESGEFIPNTKSRIL